jgi:hypothetical protein
MTFASPPFDLSSPALSQPDNQLLAGYTGIRRTGFQYSGENRGQARSL